VSQHPEQPPGDCGYGTRLTADRMHFGRGCWIALAVSSVMLGLMVLGAWFLFAHLIF
jgi:hypothetical protein